jgi:hypothetical protein
MPKDWNTLTIEEKIDQINEKINNLASQVAVLANGHDDLAKDYQKTKHTVDEFERSFEQLRRDSLFPR